MLRSSAWQRDRHGEVFAPLDHQYIIASINVTYNSAGDFDSRIHATSIGVSVLRSERLDVSIRSRFDVSDRTHYMPGKWLMSRN